MNFPWVSSSVLIFDSAHIPRPIAPTPPTDSKKYVHFTIDITLFKYMNFPWVSSSVLNFSQCSYIYIYIYIHIRKSLSPERP